MSPKTAVITGASRGIGKAVALQYAKAGYNVAISCLHHTALLEEVSELVEQQGVSCLYYTGDMGDFHQAGRFFEEVHSAFGSPDILINNAGISHIGLLQDMTPEEWDHMIHTNLNSVFYCSKLAILDMIPRKQGKIVNISSVWGNAGASMEVAYSTTKGGINAFTRALAKELAPSNIQINAIACGAIDTDMNHFLSEDELSCLLDEIPAGRMGLPEEVAHLALQITQGNDYLTGQIITLDGGWI